MVTKKEAKRKKKENGVKRSFCLCCFRRVSIKLDPAQMGAPFSREPAEALRDPLQSCRSGVLLTCGAHIATGLQVTAPTAGLFSVPTNHQSPLIPSSYASAAYLCGRVFFVRTFATDYVRSSPPRPSRCAGAESHYSAPRVIAPRGAGCLFAVVR